MTIPTFYLGGEERMKKLRGLFNILYKKNIKWFFITANPASQKSTLKKGKGNTILLQLLILSGLVSKDKRFNKFKDKYDVEDLEEILTSTKKEFKQIKKNMYSFID